MIRILLCLDSSMVEHAAVNRGVAGSSPARGGLVHGGNTGSIPVGVTSGKRSFLITASRDYFLIQGSLAQLVRATGS